MKVSLTYMVHVTVLLDQLSQVQFMPQVPFHFPQGMAEQPHQMLEGPPPQTPGMSQIPGMPPMPMHMPMPMHFPMPQPRLPVVVMPYYSKKSNKPAPPFRATRNRRPKKKYLYQESESTDESNTSSREHNYRKMARNGKVNKRRQVLTPVVSYVTQDGYVVYQKKIKKDRAKDWLAIGERKGAMNVPDAEHDREESGERLEDVKRRVRHARKRNHG